MIRKFECWDCHSRFEADDKSFVTCPNCHSENVEYASFHLPFGVIKYVGGCVVLLVLACVCMKVDWKSLFCEENKTSTQAPDQSVVVNAQDDNDDSTEGIDTSPYVKVTEPQFDGKLYSVDVMAMNISPNVRFYYACLDHFDNTKVLQKCDDGHFVGIPYCEDDGFSYDFAIFDSETDTLLCTPTTKSGFFPQKKVTRMTIAELQSLINKQDHSLLGQGESFYLSPDCHLQFIGVDNVGLPTIFSEVFERISYGEWKSVKVTKVDYDDKERISSVTMLVVPEENDF